MSKHFRPLLTTEDNPYDPFNDWEDWYAFDTQSGYDTLGLLDRVAKASGDMEDGSTRRAMAEIIRYNVSGKHIMVTAEQFDALITEQ